MISREKILIDLYNSHIVEKLTDRFWSYTAENRDDFIQMIYLQVCEIPEDRLIRLYNDHSLDFYIISIVKNQAQCDYNKFRKLYHDDRIQLVENYNDFQIIDDTL